LFGDRAFLLLSVRKEICQQLALDVMERRCECTAARRRTGAAGKYQ
jgi:hypothetical protein